MKKLFALAVLLPSLASADLGLNFPVVSDSTNEFNAKQGASNLGVTTIYDHPTDAPQGQFYVPIVYNRTGDPAAGEQDPNSPANTTDIDYTPLASLKGATGSAGTVGATGSTGVAGKDSTVAGPQGGKGDKGEKGSDANNDNQLHLNIGLGVRWYDWKYVSLNSGYRYDLRHFGHTVDIAVVEFKIGKSYEGRQLERQAKEIRDLQFALSQLDK